mmetsp:Transcript_14982/g.63083  ORF Transcript_14982/g.63083 Transcript_14982/m.63083 type:complete len:275 (-) Transcript_14982:5350-6174(-)
MGTSGQRIWPRRLPSRSGELPDTRRSPSRAPSRHARMDASTAVSSALVMFTVSPSTTSPLLESTSTVTRATSAATVNALSSPSSDPVDPAGRFSWLPNPTAFDGETAGGDSIARPHSLTRTASISASSTASALAWSAPSSCAATIAASSASSANRAATRRSSAGHDDSAPSSLRPASGIDPNPSSSGFVTGGRTPAAASKNSRHASSADSCELPRAAARPAALSASAAAPPARASGLGFPSAPPPPDPNATSCPAPSSSATRACPVATSIHEVS